MKLVLLPGIDGTGELFGAFIDALDTVDVQVIRYPSDREMTYAQHEKHARELLPRSRP